MKQKQIWNNFGRVFTQDEGSQLFEDHLDKFKLDEMEDYNSARADKETLKLFKLDPDLHVEWFYSKDGRGLTEKENLGFYMIIDDPKTFHVK